MARDMVSRGFLKSALASLALLAGPTVAKADSVTAFVEAGPNRFIGISTDVPAKTISASSNSAPALSRSVSYAATSSWPAVASVFAETSAYADLATGRLGTYVETSEGVAGRAISAWSTQVTLINPSVEVSEVWDLGIEVRFHGLISEVLGTSPGLPNYAGGASSQLDVYVGGQAVLGHQTTGQFRVRASSANPTSTSLYALKDLTSVAGGPNETIYRFTRAVIGSTVVLPISMAMDTAATNGFTADFANTAGFSFILPEGVTFSSANDVFLSAGTAVPEPGTWALMILGFGSAGAALRRRRAALA